MSHTNDLKQCAYLPLKQQNNRVWRTYGGGALIDKWKNKIPAVDGELPEQWIMSTVIAIGKGRPDDEGLTYLETPIGVKSLKELVESDKELYLGKALAEKFGTTGVLIKMLDSNERLTIQVHPDKEYAKNKLNSVFGKTESWYVLNKREIGGEPSVVYMGFKEGVTKEVWKQYFENQDIEGMLNCLHKIEVNPGDAFVIYGGVPHAIGAGCFLMEVQEPTDYTMRVEKITPAGLKIADELIHQGVGEATMLECFHYDTYSYQEALDAWKVKPQVIEFSDTFELRSIFNETHTNCFAVKELDLLESGSTYSLEANGSFYVAVIYSGEGIILCNGKEYEFKQGDEIFFSAAIDGVTFKSNIKSKILLCYPPI
jgi:mannose-6-phosphate isomerase|tara:strand:+ start:1662 stop:2771 length:1110 start_codon:yes stop_codon:yes gene_type:complete